MIYKKQDTKAEEIKILEEILIKTSSKLEKQRVEVDLKTLKSGYFAEQDNAYYLDYYFEKSKNVILLHDIRLEYNGRVAQFDHIVLNRLGIEILESKNFNGKLTIKDDGSLSVHYGTYTKTFPNPVEQNIRHIQFLKDFIANKFDTPSNTKLLGGVPISSKVLINPKTTITNKKLPNGYERADSFCSMREKETDSISFFSAVKLLSSFMQMDKVKELAELIVKSHKPIRYDYLQKYKIRQQDIKKDIKSLLQEAKPTHSCSKCQSINVYVANGKYGYYFKCLDCGGNSAIKLSHKDKYCKVKISKFGLDFYKICDTCQTKELYFRNLREY